MDTIDAYPLRYPPRWQRTRYSQNGRFDRDKSIAYARDNLIQELNRLGAKNIVISSNLKLKKDGLPYSDQREPDDSGVAVYFDLNKKSMCLPCDKWRKISHNIWAIYLTVQALRGIERWGSKDMMEATFTGFEALPSPDMIVPMSQKSYFTTYRNKTEAKPEYIRLAKALHPDNGGLVSEFTEMKRQYEQLRDD